MALGLRRSLALTGLLGLLVIAACGGGALAQDGLSGSMPADLEAQASVAGEPAEAPNTRKLADWAQALDGVRAELDRDQLTVDMLATLRDRTTALRDDIAAFVGVLAPRLAEQRALLEGLVPADGELVQTPEIEAQRQRISLLERELQPAELLLGRANALREEIIALRAVEFANRVFERSTSLITPQLWSDGVAGLPSMVQRMGDLARSSLVSVRDRATPAAFAGLGALAAVLLVLALPLRRLALRKAARAQGRKPTPFEAMRGAVRIVAVSTLVPATGFVLVLAGLDVVGGLSLRATSILNAVATNTVLFFFISGLIRAFLAPGLAAWRLVPVDDGHAGQAAAFFRLAALAYLVGELLRTLAAVFVAPLATVQMLEAVPTLIAALGIVGGVRAVLRGLNPKTLDGPPPIVHLLWRWTLPLAGLCALVVIGAQLFGYLALAAFIVDRVLWTAVVLAALHLAAGIVEGLTSSTLQEDTRAAGWLAENVGLSRSGLGQFGVLLAGVIKLVLILAAGSLIIAPFGVETGQLTDVFRRVFTGIEIGGFSFSLTSILMALALVFAGIVVTRAVQGWLENRYLPRTALDTGLKASIRTAVGYVGIIAAAGIGLSSLGLNLENVALVAGALSVGIGFGLQSIVSNFVSGLILLAERPFKQGDWIVVGEEQGIVKRINVRATELQTFDRATVLIPNSDFIAGTVKNRVHRDTLGRIDVPVGVGYDSDPLQVKAILLEVANAHPMTLSYPEPAAFFVEFGANSLDFMLFAYLADVGNGYSVRSDLRFEIFRRFKEEGIEIPFAQSDVTIRNLDQILEVLAKAGGSLPEGLGAGGLTPDAGVKQAGVSTVPAPEPSLSTPGEMRAGRRIDPDGDGEAQGDPGPAERS